MLGGDPIKRWAVPASARARFGPAAWRDARIADQVLVVVALMAVVASAILVARNGLNGPWYDEYATLWFSDPAIDIAGLYRDRWSQETNPPLFYWLVRSALSLADFDIFELRLANVAGFALSVGYLLFRAWRMPLLRPFIGCVLTIYITNEEVNRNVLLLRSYSLQESTGLVLCFLIAALIYKQEKLARADLLVLFISIFVLMNTHFMSALFCGLLVVIAILYLRLAGRRRQAGVLACVLLASAVPAGIFVLASYAALLERSRHFWITTTPTEAVIMMARVGTTFFSGNLALVGLLGLAAVFSGWPRHAAAADAAPPGRAGAAGLVLGLAVAGFFAVLFAVNARTPIVILRYLAVTGPALMVGAGVLVAPLLRRWPVLLLPVLGNGLVVMALHPYGPAHPGDYPAIAAIAGLRSACPDASVYGLWREDGMGGIFVTAYRYISDHYGMPMQVRQAGQPWTPPANPACPTVLWNEYMWGPSFPRSAAEFAADFHLRLDPATLARADFRPFPASGNVLLILPAVDAAPDRGMGAPPWPVPAPPSSSSPPAPAAGSAPGHPSSSSPSPDGR